MPKSGGEKKEARGSREFDLSLRRLDYVIKRDPLVRYNPKATYPKKPHWFYEVVVITDFMNVRNNKIIKRDCEGWSNMRYDLKKEYPVMLAQAIHRAKADADERDTGSEPRHADEWVELSEGRSVKIMLLRELPWRKNSNWSPKPVSFAPKKKPSKRSTTRPIEVKGKMYELVARRSRSGKVQYYYHRSVPELKRDGKRKDNKKKR